MKMKKKINSPFARMDNRTVVAGSAPVMRPRREEAKSQPDTEPITVEDIAIQKQVDREFRQEQIDGQSPIIRAVPLESIESLPQVRTTFDKEALLELKESIKEYGLLQPITVVPKPFSKNYIVLIGERRLRAARMLMAEDPSKNTILAIIRTVKGMNDEVDMSEWSAEAQSYWTSVQLMENMKRAELNAIETAQSIKKLVDLGLSHQEISERIGKSRVWVTQSVSVATRASSEILDYAEQHQIKDLYLLYSLIRLWEKNEQAARELMKSESITTRMIRQAAAADDSAHEKQQEVPADNPAVVIPTREFSSVAGTTVEEIKNDAPTEVSGRDFSSSDSTAPGFDSGNTSLTDDGGSSVNQVQKSVTEQNTPEEIPGRPAKSQPSRYVYVVRLKNRKVKDEKEYMLDMHSKTLSEDGTVAIKPLYGGTDRRVVSVDEIVFIGARFVKGPLTQGARFDDDEEA